MELDFTQLMLLISVGMNLVGMLLIHRSVPREILNDYLKRVDDAVVKTPNKIDDAIASLQRSGATALEKMGVLKVTDTTTTTISTPPIDSVGKSGTMDFTPDKLDNDLSAAG